MAKIVRVRTTTALMVIFPVLVHAQARAKPQPSPGTSNVPASTAQVPGANVSLASRAEARGDLVSARKLYEKAIQLAEQNKDTRALSQAFLDYARVSELGAAEDSGGKFNLDDARAAYEKVIKIGTPTQVLHAENNLGVLLLKQGKADEALHFYKAMNGPPLFCPPGAGKSCKSPFGSKELAELPKGYIYSYNA